MGCVVNWTAVMWLGALKMRIQCDAISKKINNRKQKIVVAWPCTERSQGEGPGQAIKGDQEKKGGWLVW